MINFNNFVTLAERIPYLHLGLHSDIIELLKTLPKAVVNKVIKAGFDTFLDLVPIVVRDRKIPFSLA